jgi:hypothetical protein
VSFLDRCIDYQRFLKYAFIMSKPYLKPEKVAGIRTKEQIPIDRRHKKLIITVSLITTVISYLKLQPLGKKTIPSPAKKRL